MSVLSALGFDIASREVYRGWIERTLAQGTEIPQDSYPHLHVRRWAVGDQGITLWAAVEEGDPRRTVAFFPAFRARTVAPFMFSALSFPDSPYEPVASGHLLSSPLAQLWASYPDSDYEPVRSSRDTEVEVQVVNYLGLAPEAFRPGTAFRARMVGLAGQGIVVEPPDTAPFASLFMQARLAHHDPDILPNFYGIAGAIREWEVITNPATEKQIAWLRLSLEGQQDAEIVGEVEGIQGTLAPGAIAFAECYLQAELEA